VHLENKRLSTIHNTTRAKGSVEEVLILEFWRTFGMCKPE
jgi:hypothetical protein